MRTYALWRAERGDSLGILKLLYGSQNLLAAFERSFWLRRLGFISSLVMLIWALSPVGGQSALRVLSRDILSSSNTTIIYYFNTSGDGSGGAFSGASSLATYEPLMNAIFQASLTSLERVKGRDIWGHVKIPVLQYVPSYAADQSKNGWYDFVEDDYDSSYSSLTGLVVSGLKKEMETNFNIESSYFNLTCAEPVFFEKDVNIADNSLGGFETWIGTRPERGDNSSNLFFRSDSRLWGSYMIDTNYIYTPSTDAEPRYNVIYASKSMQSTNPDFDEIAAYNCTVGVTHVENEVTCGSDCRIKRIRLSHRADWSDSGWPWPVSSDVPPRTLLLWLERISSVKTPSSVSPLDFYVRGFDNPYFPMASDRVSLSYRNVSGLDVAKRLQSLINTAWQISNQGPATAKRPEKNETALILSTNPGTHNLSDGVGYFVSATNATTVEKHHVFASNTIWIVITTIISFILVICGSLTLIFKYGTNSPDILGYVSSMTRDNPNFEQIPDGDNLDGLDRARVLQHLKVQIVDVKSWDPNGYITLKPLDQINS